MAALSPPIEHPTAHQVSGLPAAELQTQAFRGLLQGIACIAGLTHVSFLALFVWAKVDALAVVNVASVLCYVWTFLLARRGRVGESWGLTVAEVLGHAVLATIVIGWGSGFHHYILLVIPVAVVSPIRPIWLKVALVVAVAATYLGLDLGLRHHSPPYALGPKVLEGLYYFNVLGTMLILAFLAACYYYLINQAQAALREMASTDPLTQLRNRRSIMEAIHLEEQRMKRGHPQLSFVLCDIDHFKAINDSCGHEAGDAVLKAASGVLASGLRQVDCLARWGGEEFLIMLPDTDAKGAIILAERLRERIEAASMAWAGQSLKISMTFGVATLAHGERADRAIARADAALYEGKHGGRNRVVAAQGEGSIQV